MSVDLSRVKMSALNCVCRRVQMSALNCVCRLVLKYTRLMCRCVTFVTVYCKFHWRNAIKFYSEQQELRLLKILITISPLTIDVFWDALWQESGAEINKIGLARGAGYRFKITCVDSMETCK